MSSGIILNTYIATPIFKDTIDVCRIRLEYMFCFRNRNEYARIDFVPEIVYADDWRDDAGTGLYTVDQERNHVFEVGGPIPWSMVLLPFYKKNRQVYPVWCSRLHNHTLFIKRLCKSWGFVQILGRSGPPLPSGCAHAVDCIIMVDIGLLCVKTWSTSTTVDCYRFAT